MRTLCQPLLDFSFNRPSQRHSYITDYFVDAITPSINPVSFQRKQSE